MWKFCEIKSSFSVRKVFVLILGSRLQGHSRLLKGRKKIWHTVFPEHLFLKGFSKGMNQMDLFSAPETQFS